MALDGLNLFSVGRLAQLKSALRLMKLTGGQSRCETLRSAGSFSGQSSRCCAERAGAALIGGR
jgi:hypothetical protein